MAPIWIYPLTLHGLFDENAYLARLGPSSNRGCRRLGAASQRTRRKAPTRQVNIRTQTVCKQSLAEPTLKLVGKLAANRSVIISPEVTGRIVKIAVQSGQSVAKGETLIALDAGKQQADCPEQSASLRDENRKLGDMRKLVARGAVTQSELEGQEATVAQVQARLDAAAELSCVPCRRPLPVP